MKNKVKNLLESILKESSEDKAKIKLVPLWQDREEKRLKQYLKILQREVIEGDLDLSGSPIENIGNIKHVKGCLDLENCKNLKELPVGLIVDTWLDLYNCKGLTSLPPDLKVGGKIYLENCRESVIQQALKIFIGNQVVYKYN